MSLTPSTSSDSGSAQFNTVPYKGSSVIISDTPSNFRLATKLDGTLVLQGGFIAEGMDTSATYVVKKLIWKDLPTVDLDE